MYKFSLISTTSRESSCSPGVGEDKQLILHVPHDHPASHLIAVARTSVLG
jgi:hypothetical protein